MPPPYCYDYPRPSVTVDLAIFALSPDGLRVLLIRRKHDPFAGSWALPGGFLEIDEAIEAGARRELLEETGFASPGPLSFLGVYGDPGRDPRGRTISLAHASVVRGTPRKFKGGDDAAEAAWRLVRGPSNSPLAFDHDAMLAQAQGWLAEGVRAGNLGLALLSQEFDGADADALFRAIGDKPAAATRWLRRMEKAKQIEPLAGSAHSFRIVQNGGSE